MKNKERKLLLKPGMPLSNKATISRTILVTQTKLSTSQESTKTKMPSLKLMLLKLSSKKRTQISNFQKRPKHQKLWRVKP